MSDPRPYLAAFAVRFQLTLQYRSAALAGAVTQLWWGIVRCAILAAFLAGSTRPAPLSLPQTITYVWLGQAFLAFLPWQADPEVREMVRGGSVAYERLRPLDTYGWWYARAMARAMANVAPRAFLMFVVAAIVLPLIGLQAWSLRPPATITASILFGVSIIAVAVLSASIVLLINIISVAQSTDRGVTVFFAMASNFFAGLVVPLSFFPDSVRPALRLQPFAGLADIPFRIYCGDLSDGPAVAAIGLQLTWTLLLIAVGRWWLERVMAKLQVNGG